MRKALILIALAAFAEPSFAGERTVTLAVENMYCAACPYIVRESLASVAGVVDVAVSYEEKTAVVTFCPVCGYRTTQSMPIDACLFFHECAGCRTLLKPKAGDCCVFCSYGDVACPPVQEAREGRGAAACRS